MESTGAKNKIHVSVETAERLRSQGKGHWCIPREDRVVAKGKGELSTCWLVLKGDNAQSSRSGASSDTESAGVPDASLVGASNEVATATPLGTRSPDRSPVVEDTEVTKRGKLANWNAEILARYLKDIVATRVASGKKSDPVELLTQLETESLHLDTTVLDEVTEVIDLPEIKYAPGVETVDPSAIELPDAVLVQLRGYVMTIALLYRDNSFHNLEHASHVTMSAVKLLARIVAADVESADGKVTDDRAYGIASDPLTHFALVFSALIHDLDHTGVPNGTLIKEQATIAAVYNNKSVAEQNSVDIAWELLLQPQYDDLRRTIYVTGEEFRRFRQLLINLVIATDIMDKDLGRDRRDRWNRAFAESASADADGKLSVLTRNLRANIVLEHAIQASDVSHTMQHWAVFRKWNGCLFDEMYRAYLEGRSDQDPAEKWYEGELNFFDFYVIPLAKKLNECGLFGVSSAEYLDYAQRNRREWETKGREIVREMVESATNGKRNH
jgi:hypothetical protein